MMVVADLYQLKDRDNGVFKVDGSKAIERKGMKVQQEYVDQINGNSKDNGKLFVVDGEATEAWKIANAEGIERKKLANEKTKLGLTEQAEALIEKSKAPKKGRPAKTEE